MTLPTKTIAKTVPAVLAFAAFAGALACKPRTAAPQSDTTADDFSRHVIGRALPYTAQAVDSQKLGSDFRERRKFGWEVAARVFAPVGVAAPHEAAALWQTWYSADEFEKIFTRFYEAIPVENRWFDGASPASRLPGDEVLRIAGCVLDEYGSEAYLKKKYGVLFRQVAPRRIAQLKNSVPNSLNGVGLATSLFNESVIRHYLRNYESAANCKKDDASCFASPFPRDAALVKAVWAREGDEIQAFDTTQSGLGKSLGSGDWVPLCDDGGCTVDPESDFFRHKFIVTSMTLPDGNPQKWRLLGLHIATRETPDWTWVSLWWAKDANSDFGQDRPVSFGGGASRLHPALANYKMCVATDFVEKDERILVRAQNPNTADEKSLIETTARATGASDGKNLTWCSNPYIEKESAMLDSNCLGCHQAAGPSSDMAFRRDKMERIGPADYMWSFEFTQHHDASTGDNFAAKIKRVTLSSKLAPHKPCGQP